MRSLQEALTTAVSTGRGVPGIAAVLHDALDATVVVDDGLRTRLARAGGGPAGLSLPTQHRSAGSHHAVAFRSGNWVLVDASPGGELLAVIGMYDPAGTASLGDEQSLAQGAMVLAAEMFRLHSVAANELRVWGDLTAELLDSPDIERTRAHAAALGYPIDRPHRAVFVEPAKAGAPSMATIRRAFRAARIDGSLATQRGTGFVLLVADDVDWDDFAEQLNGLDQPQMRLGIGDRHHPASLHQSVAEAILALRLSHAAVARYEDLGISRFLASDTDEERLRSFVHDWLGDLEAYDAAHATELVHTLGQWLRDQRSLRSTAERLHIHPSTLKYRLHRISDLIGRDLHDPEDRFNLDLACRTRETLLAAQASGFRRCAADPAVEVTTHPPETRPSPSGASSSAVEVAVLDAEGVISWVNDAWIEFGATNGGTPEQSGVGTSYFDACSGASDDPQSLLALAAVRLALLGDLPAPAWLTMACHGPDASRWYEMSVSSRQDDSGQSCGATITFTQTTH